MLRLCETTQKLDNQHKIARPSCHLHVKLSTKECDTARLAKQLMLRSFGGVPVAVPNIAAAVA